MFSYTFFLEYLHSYLRLLISIRIYICAQKSSNKHLCREGQTRGSEREGEGEGEGEWERGVSGHQIGQSGANGTHQIGSRDQREGYDRILAQPGQECGHLREEQRQSEMVNPGLITI